MGSCLIDHRVTLARLFDRPGRRPGKLNKRCARPARAATLVRHVRLTFWLFDPGAGLHHGDHGCWRAGLNWLTPSADQPDQLAQAVCHCTGSRCRLADSSRGAAEVRGFGPLPVPPKRRQAYARETDQPKRTSG